MNLFHDSRTSKEHNSTAYMLGIYNVNLNGNNFQYTDEPQKSNPTVSSQKTLPSLLSVVKVEIQRWETVISGFGPCWRVVGPLLTVLDLCAPTGGHGPEATELTSLSSNQAFTFTSLTWILSRKKW